MVPFAPSRCEERAGAFLLEVELWLRAVPFDEFANGVIVGTLETDGREPVKNH
jgi:hypothetical protein